MCGPSSSSIALRHCDFKQKTAYEILASLEFRRVLFRSFLRSLPERFGPEADTGLRESGYLLLAGEAGRAVLTANHAVQTAEGADIALLDPAGVGARFPRLRADRKGVV